MTYQEIKKRYNYLSSAEIEAELKYRTTRRRSTWMQGAADCDSDANVIRACREILKERREA